MDCRAWDANLPCDRCLTYLKYRVSKAMVVAVLFAFGSDEIGGDTFGMDVNQIYLIQILNRGQCVITFQPNRRLPAKIC